MASQKPIAAPSESDHIEQCQKAGHVVAEAIAIDKGQATSGYENLSLWDTVTTFKVATVTCFLAAFSAATDGYQIGSVFARHIDSHPDLNISIHNYILVSMHAPILVFIHISIHVSVHVCLG